MPKFTEQQVRQYLADRDVNLRDPEYGMPGIIEMLSAYADDLAKSEECAAFLAKCRESIADALAENPDRRATMVDGKALFFSRTGDPQPGDEPFEVCPHCGGSGEAKDCEKAEPVAWFSPGVGLPYGWTEKQPTDDAVFLYRHPAPVTRATSICGHFPAIINGMRTNGDWEFVPDPAFSYLIEVDQAVDPARLRKVLEALEIYASAYNDAWVSGMDILEPIGDEAIAELRALLAAAPAAPQQDDPCPGCPKGSVYRTPKCGRLAAPQKGLQP